MRISRNYVGERTAKLIGLIALSAALDIAAAVGLAYVAGFGAMRAWVGRFSPIWIVAIAGGVVVSFVGYYFAYRDTYQAEGGPTMSPNQLRAVVVAGFGGFFAHGGAAMDEYALEGAGASSREASVRVTALGGLEHGALGIIGTAAAIVALAMSRPAPPIDFQLPWAVIPLPGFLLAFWLAERYRDRFRDDTKRVRRAIGILLDAIHVLRHMFRNPRDHIAGPGGMCLFWLAELWAVWAALASFGFRMNGASFVIGFLTGAVFTRRTGPLAGAGILMLCLPVTIWYSGAPLAAAVLAVYVTRFLSFWLPLPFSLMSLPTLRQIGMKEKPGAESTASSDEGEPILERPRQAS